MTELVACISPNKDMWPHVASLIDKGNWENSFIITDNSGKANFKTAKKVEFITVDFNKPVFELIQEIQKSLKPKLKGIEVAVNIVSGNGKQHMAILSSLLKLGLAIRFVAVTREGIKEI